jgi:hypothetical protein
VQKDVAGLQGCGVAVARQLAREGHDAFDEIVGHVGHELLGLLVCARARGGKPELQGSMPPGRPHAAATYPLVRVDLVEQLNDLGGREHLANGMGAAWGRNA